MKTLLVALVLATSLAGVAARADSSCQAKAADKKLHGAAETSFVKKCEKDSKAASAAETCKSQAADKKLHGAAENSFVKKCIKDNSK